MVLGERILNWLEVVRAGATSAYNKKNVVSKHNMMSMEIQDLSARTKNAIYL